MNQVELQIIIDKLSAIYDSLYEKDDIDNADAIGHIMDELESCKPYMETGL